MKQNVTKLKGRIDNSTIVGDLNTTLSIINRTKGKYKI